MLRLTFPCMNDYKYLKCVKCSKIIAEPEQLVRIEKDRFADCHEMRLEIPKSIEARVGMPFIKILEPCASVCCS